MADRDRARSSIDQLGLDELNLVEFPLGLLSDKRPPGLKTLRFEDEVKDQASGRRIVRRVVVTGADEWGLPNWQDIDVLLGLMKLTNDRHGFRDARLEFSLYELRELLEWPANSSYKRRLKESILRLLGVTVAYENAWRKNGEWKSTTAFHLLEVAELTNTKEFFDSSEVQHVYWNRKVVESVRAGNRKLVDWPFYLSLKLPTTKRLYRLLDKRFGLDGSRPWNFDLGTFCYEKLGMSRTLELKACKRQLGMAIDELEQVKYLASDDSRFERVAKGVFSVSFRKGSGVVVSLPPEKKVTTDATCPLTAKLLERNVTNARALVEKFPADRIELQIENYDDRMKHGETLSPGWLRMAIESEAGYGFRKGYKTSAERNAMAEKKRAKAEKAESDRKAAEENERKRVEAERHKVDVFLSSLGGQASQDAFFESLLENGGFAVAQYQRALRNENEDAAKLYRDVILREAIVVSDKEARGA